MPSAAPALGLQAASAQHHAFAEELLATTRQRLSTAGTSSPQFPSADVEIAGLHVRLIARTRSLLQTHLTPLPAAPPVEGAPGQADLTVWLWAEEEGDPPRTAMPPALREQLMRGDLRRPARDSKFPLIYQAESRAITVIDRRASEAVVWLPREDRMAWYERAAPLRGVLAWLLESRGRLMVHAAGLASPRGAVLLVGASGAGKSTTALHGLSHGMALLGDDVVAARPGDPPSVHQMYRTTKTTRSQRSMPATRGLELVNPAGGHEEKAVHLLPESAIQTSGFPLRKILVLDRHSATDAPGLYPATTSHATQLIGATTMPLAPTAGPAFLTGLAALVRSAPVCRLVLARDGVAVARQVASAISDSD